MEQEGSSGSGISSLQKRLHIALGLAVGQRAHGRCGGQALGLLESVSRFGDPGVLQLNHRKILLSISSIHFLWKRVPPAHWLNTRRTIKCRRETFGLIMPRQSGSFLFSTGMSRGTGSMA